MDEKAIDAEGLAPLQAELGRIRNLADKSQLQKMLTCTATAFGIFDQLRQQMAMWRPVRICR